MLRLPLTKIEEMFELYCDGLSVRKIGEEANVAKDTVLKYVHKGNPQIGVLPFKIRFARLKEELAKETDDIIKSKLRIATENSLDALDVTVNRYVDRVNKAHLLEDEAIYEEGNYSKRKAVEEQAYNPNAKDVSMLADSCAKLVKNDESVSIHVNQNQQAIAASSAEMRGYDIVTEHIKKKQKDTDTKDEEQLVIEISQAIDANESSS